MEPLFILRFERTRRKNALIVSAVFRRLCYRLSFERHRWTLLPMEPSYALLRLLQTRPSPLPLNPCLVRHLVQRCSD